MHMHVSRILIALLLMTFPASAGAQALAQCVAAPQDVSMQLSSELAATVPSASVGIFAAIENASAETLTGEAIAVEVVRKSDGAIVDRFIAEQRVTVFADSPAKVGFIWKVPPGLVNGTYIVVASLAPEDAPRAQVYAHVGYPTARLEIDVQDGREDALAIRSVEVNGVSYAPWTVADVSEGSVSAQVTAANSQAAPYKGIMSWDLYAHDAGLTAEPLEHTDMSVELHPGATQSIAYRLPGGESGAYYIEATLRDATGGSRVDILLDRGGDAFSWAACVPDAPPRGTKGGTYALFAVLAAVLVLGVWLEVRHKWTFSRS